MRQPSAQHQTAKVHRKQQQSSMSCSWHQTVRDTCNVNEDEQLSTFDLQSVNPRALEHLTRWQQTMHRLDGIAHPMALLWTPISMRQFAHGKTLLSMCWKRSACVLHLCARFFGSLCAAALHNQLIAIVQRHQHHCFVPVPADARHRLDMGTQQRPGQGRHKSVGEH